MYDPEKHYRQSIRLKGYDYSEEGAYFITICAHHRECRFGNIQHGEMILNDAGKMIEKWWLELGNKFTNIALGAFVVMPNHFHGIIFIQNDDDVGANLCVRPGQTRRSAPTEPKTEFPTIGNMVQWFKTMTTNEYIRGIKSGIFPPFDKRLWQRNYYEHILRDEKSLENIRDYIVSNPAKWEEDSLFYQS